MADLCEGMEFLHSGVGGDPAVKRQVFHQDIKSSNVLLKYEQDGDLRAKISDFGLSSIYIYASYRRLTHPHHTTTRDP